jgi:hypothetical protein
MQRGLRLRDDVFVSGFTGLPEAGEPPPALNKLWAERPWLNHCETA